MKNSVCFKFNQTQPYRRRNTAFALFSLCADALVAVILCYALSNFVLLCTDSDIDVTDMPYVTVFVAVYIITATVLITVYYKTQKGIVVTENELIITTGYSAKLGFFRIKIALSDIEGVTYIDAPWTKEQKRDYRNYEYAWHTVGIGLQTVPVIRINTKGEHPRIILFSCNEPEKLVDALQHR